jgi:hypothetical protein
MMTVLVALVAAGCWIAAAQAGKSAARGSSAAVEKKARELAAQNERDSVKRSVDTCNRGNPGRAYLLIRAGEFTKTSTLKESFTTGISPSVWGILYCEATVRQGTNVALAPSVQREYLRIFRHRLVPVVVNGRITSYIPFSIYFRRVAAGASPR